MKQKRKIAVVDFETDPFLYGREPLPFACGFYDGSNYLEFWGDDCVLQLSEFLTNSFQKYYIFAHNGGKFDFIYLLREGMIQNPVKIINSRIVSAGCVGGHILRDSFAILPIPLATYKKDDIDYSWFEKECREEFKNEILHYLSKDCEYLYELVYAFVDRFGIQLTIGGTSIKELSRLHNFERLNAEHDKKFRQFYFGGRVECFSHGKIEKNLKVYDVNSMYPFVMSQLKHPIGKDYNELYGNIRLTRTNDIYGYPDKPYFICFQGRNYGALPFKTKKGLDFNIEEGEFFTTSHELKVALKYNLVEIDTINYAYVACNTITFDRFVGKFSEEKINAKRSGDKVAELFAKLIQNSSYGKFGQNPENFEEYFFRFSDTDPLPDDFELWELKQDYEGAELWAKPSNSESYLDVAVAASITSAARSILLDAIQTAKGVIYCDTDSIICESFAGNIDKYLLGFWDLECECDTAYIAGKKMYALYNNGECVKLASKGVRLTGDDIIKLCDGKEIIYDRAAPNFKLSGDTKFISRKIKQTY